MDDFVEIELNALKFASMEHIPFEIIANCRIDEHKDICSERLIRRLVAYIFSRKCQRVEIKYPLTAWDHIKQDYFPEYLKSKFPPKYQVEVFEQIEIFPELKMNNCSSMHIMQRDSYIEPIESCEYNLDEEY